MGKVPPGAEMTGSSVSLLLPCLLAAQDEGILPAESRRESLMRACDLPGSDKRTRRKGTTEAARAHCGPSSDGRFRRVEGSVQLRDTPALPQPVSHNESGYKSRTTVWGRLA